MYISTHVLIVNGEMEAVAADFETDLAVWARVFEAVGELVVDFAEDAGGETRAVLGEEGLNSGGVALGEFAESPGEGFDDHVVAVIEEEGADGECAGGVAGAAAGLVVEADGGDEGDAPPPVIGRAGPLDDEGIGDEAETPDGAREGGGVGVDGEPGVEPPA
jgi:hypothetical protein